MKMVLSFFLFLGISCLVFSPSFSVVAAEPQILNACQPLATRMEYRLGSDLTIQSQGAACFSGQDIEDTVVDCQNHEIFLSLPEGASADAWAFLRLDHVSRVTLKNCQVKLQSPTWTGLKMMSLIKNSVDVRFEGNRFLASAARAETPPMAIAFIEARNTHLLRNEFEAEIDFDKTEKTLVEDNAFRWLGETDVPGLLLFSNGRQNTARGNTFSGRPIDRMHVGVDDAIVLGDEEQALIEGNRMHDFYDCGIETANTVNNSVIRNNFIKDTLVCGIGGWYSSSLRGNTFEANTLDVAHPFRFNRTYGRREGEGEVFFANNQFLNNLVPSTRTAPEGQPSTFSIFDFGRVYLPERSSSPLLASEIVVTGNVFRGNDFGQKGQALFTPASIMQDGGGNKCTDSAPLVCDVVADSGQTLITAAEAGFTLEDTGTTNSVRLSWRAPLLHVSLYRSTDAGVRGQQILNKENVGVWYDNTALPKVDYTYRLVETINGSEREIARQSIRLSPTPKRGPSGMKVIKQKTGLALSWEIPSYYTSVSSVRIYRSFVKGTKGKRIAQLPIKQRAFLDKAAGQRRPVFYTFTTVTKTGIESVNNDQVRY